MIAGRRFLLVAVGAMTLATALTAQAPVAVSPGSAAAPVALGTSCPTFSWSGVAAATDYELVLYQAGVDGTLGIVLQTRVPGDARAWSPSAAVCPEPGFQYAWAVRASTDEGTGEWSEPLLFATPGEPTLDEVRRALETLRRYRQGAAEEDLSPVETSVDGDNAAAPVLPGAEDRLPPLRGVQMSDRSTVAPRPNALPLGDPLTAPTVGNEPSPSDVVAPGSYSLSLDGDLDLGGAIFREGYPFLHNDGGPAFGNVGLGLLAMVSLTPGDPDPDSGFENTAVGGRALKDTTSGKQNTAVGFDALRDTSTGNVNTAVGSRALRNNTSGFSNTAVGDRAARSNSTGSYNTAVGRAALYSATNPFHNTAVGYRALVLGTGHYNTAVGSLTLSGSTAGQANTAVGFSAMAETSGRSNTAVGYEAMRNLSTGRANTAVGESAGLLWTSGSFNIAIGGYVFGEASDSSVIRIGNDSFQSKTFVAGIHGATVSGGSQVFINSSHQLGTLTSSARFKRDIDDLEGVSDRLLALRPVSFRYKDEIVEPEEGENPLEFGLIAEEVAEVFPELVIYDDEGRPYTVRYHLLTPLLLAEIQRQGKALRRLEALAGRRGFAEHIDCLR